MPDPLPKKPSAEESRRYVQVVSRAMRVMQELNTTTGATVSVIAQKVGISRGTAFRIMETLLRDGYVLKDDKTFHYSVSHNVTSLSQGYTMARWVDAVRPRLQALGETILWPVNIATPAGSFVEVRCATDFDSPLVHARVTAGQRFPIIRGSEASMALAHCTEIQREGILECYFEEFRPADDYEKWRAEVHHSIEQTRLRGYQHRLTRPASSLHVPLVVNGRGFGIITTWYYVKSLRPSAALQRILPHLQAARSDIEALITQSLDD